MNERLGYLAFLASVAVLAFAVGIAFALLQPPPFSMVKRHIENVADTVVYWKNDFGIEPTRYLRPERGARPANPILQPDKLAEGWRVIAGYVRDRSSPAGAILFDEQGNERFFWPIDPQVIRDAIGVTNPRSRNAVLHGFELLRDGSIAVSFDVGDIMARLDSCGRVLWGKDGAFHHSIGLEDDGTLWVSGVLDDKNGISQIGVETGEVLWSQRFFDDAFLGGDHRGILQIAREVTEHNPRWDSGDPMHINDVAVLSAEFAGAFPQFNAGDIMVSLRNLNLVVILDADTKRAKWWQHGPWHRQHDPDFLPNGHISVFDNNMHGGQSQIVEIDPVTRETQVVFEGSVEAPFYTWVMGKHQRLDNGNILIVEAEAGRVFEVTQSGEVVWDYRNAYDEERNMLVTNAVVLPKDFFDAGVPKCPDPRP